MDLPRGHCVDCVNQVAGHLIQLKPLSQRGLVKDVKRFVVKAGKVDVE